MKIINTNYAGILDLQLTELVFIEKVEIIMAKKVPSCPNLKNLNNNS